ncbi:MAG: FkbM family methyltransferase [Saprospiraceae bacterium]|nr:MAG: FkbM family methyltransferase [Saprospiraceae bacterium]
MRKRLEKIFGKFHSYPYIHTHHNFKVGGQKVQFHINNPVERFRLQNWGWEKALILDALTLSKEGDIFYDIGASVGAISIPVGMKIKPGRVISFEPDPENAASLRGNFLLNKVEGFKIIPCAVADSAGEMQLFTQGSNGWSPSLRQVNGIQSSIPVKIVTVDGLLQTGEIPPPNVMKIDIEGAEMLALKGMSNLLSGADKPRLIILEIHPKFLPAFDTNVTEIFRFVLDRNFKIDWMESRSDQILCKLTA